MEEVVALASDLIEIPSHEDETAAGDAIERWLADNTDADVDRDDRGNVIARRGSGDASLALVGHHDVVPPADWHLDDQGRPRAWVEGDRLFGRGSADMKGAVAAMMLAFRDADPAGELVLASFVGEETGGIGAQYAVEDGFAPTYAIVGEGSAGYATPGALDVVVAHRGRRHSTLTATGEAAHAGDPSAGINAIYRAIDAVEHLRDLDRPTATYAHEPLQGTLEATAIEAGGASNVIPDRCAVTFDERTIPDRRLPLADAVADREGIEWDVIQDWPPMACENEGYITAVQDVLSEAQGVDVERVTKPHATDASWLAAAGTSCLIVGPAERGEAHTDEESVSIDRLEASYAGYRAIAEAAATFG